MIKMKKLYMMKYMAIRIGDARSGNERPGVVTSCVAW